MFEFESGIGLVVLPFIFGSFGESRLLVEWCAGGRSRRPSAEDRGWSHRSDTQWPSD
jgi:hypothetical protein